MARRAPRQAGPLSRPRVASGGAIALAALAALAGPGAAPDEPYAGKLSGDRTFAAELARIPELRRQALANVKARLGLEPRRAERIRIEVRDALPADAEKLVPSRSTAFETSTRKDEPGKPVVIRVHAEFVHSGVADLAEGLAHEMVHAVMRERSDEEVHAKIPRWVREGLALWAAGQGGTRVRWILTQRRALDGYEPSFPGLESGKHDFDRYAEDFLAVELIERRRGAKAVADLAQALVEGKPIAQAVRSAAGMSYEEFEEEAKRHGLARAKELEPEGWADFGAISKLDRERRYDQVIAAAARFEKQNPKSFVLADVLYYRGKAERLLDRHDDAAKTLSRLLAKERGRCHFADEALYQLGRAELERRRPAEAAQALEAIALDFPDTSLFDPATYWLAQALFECGRIDEARRWLDLFERSFPGSKVAGDAAKLRERLAGASASGR